MSKCEFNMKFLVTHTGMHSIGRVLLIASAVQWLVSCTGTLEVHVCFPTEP